MKKIPLRPHLSSTRKVVCTVSAAALMLGVSHGATIGLHFMENYCGAYSYSGFPVTMTAFGVAPSGWENLAEMQTGYGSCNPLVGPSVYTTNEVINTSTSTGGLNPLPNGSLTVTWSANGANFSGFSGYALIANTIPYGLYAYDGNPPVPLPTGESEVYATFLRDGINFGQGSNNGDNNAPGYSVDVVGLKSVFTNTPYVVELIASADSIQFLTNAFVIDVPGLTTNSVTYPSTPFPFRNEGGGPPWYRGHGGGLSTVSAVLNTDHIQIMSNHPQHGTNSALGTSWDLGGTISGFIVTDKPVITMSPQPVPVGMGDTITWSAYAVGVPPLSYQWLKNGVPIPGASTLSFSLTNVTAANLGNYSLVVTNLYGSATSSVVTVDMIVETTIANRVIDSNPNGPAHDGLDSGATWQASYTDGNGTNRTGLMSFNGMNNQITVPAFTAFNSTNGTIMFWMQTTQAVGSAGSAVLFDRYTDTNFNTGVRIVVEPESTIGILQVKLGTNSFDTTGLGTAINDGSWHHIAVSYDQSGDNGIQFYVDGTLVEQNTGAPFSILPSQEVELGLSHNTTATSYVPFQGLISDFRIYTTNLTSDQISSVISSNSVVNTNALALRLNFAAPPSPGLLLTWQVSDGILQSASLVNGPYTDVSVIGSKYITTPSQPMLFYEYRGHTSVTNVSNPYQM